MEVGQALNRDIAHGEAVESELDSFISRRDTQRRKDEGERDEEALWRASERRAEARRKAENRRGWVGWHRSRATLYARLSEEHARKAAGLAEGVA